MNLADLLLVLVQVVNVIPGLPDVRQYVFFVGSELLFYGLRVWGLKKYQGLPYRRAEPLPVPSGQFGLRSPSKFLFFSQQKLFKVIKSLNFKKKTKNVKH